uniref:Transmembrane protein 254 n=1 Tax=Propithecus coquereli TaxID=379532 RepID=A0A2K6G5A6_PROCO
MATAAGGAAYFQRGSLLWFTVIILSFGYYTKNGGPDDCSEFLCGLSSGLRVSLTRASGPWAPSRSIWLTTITPSCAMGIGLPG